MSNIFRRVTTGLSDSPLIIAVFLSALVALMIGCVHLAEDTISSYFGYQQLVESYGVVPVTFGITWLTLSIAPQIGTILSGYIYMQDTTQKKFLVIAMSLFLLDFASDWWHRSNDGLIIKELGNAIMFAAGSPYATAAPLEPSIMAAIVSALFTFLAFTVGAEFFIVIGVGIIGESYVPFFSQLGKTIAGAKIGWRKARAEMQAAARSGRH